MRLLVLSTLAILAIAVLGSAATYSQSTAPVVSVLVGDGDDEWSKTAVLTYENGKMVVYVAGNKWRQPIAAKIDLTLGKPIWAVVIGDRNKGDLGDWPEFRDLVLCGKYVAVVGYSDAKLGAKDVLIVVLDRASGKIVWMKRLGDPNAEDKGYGIACDDRYLYVTGYTKGLGADRRDIIVAKLELETGKLVKMGRIDAASSGDSEYGVDIAVAGDKIIVVGMTNAFDEKTYDVLVVVLTKDLDLEKSFVVGKKKVYEIAAYSNFKNSGGAIAVDGNRLYVLAQMKDPEAGKTSTLVFAFTLGGELLWAKRIYNATDISVEYYPDQIAIGKNYIYVAGHSWFYPGLWKEGGFLAVIDKTSGKIEEFYVIVDKKLMSGMGAHGVGAATIGDVDAVALVLDYYLTDRGRATVKDLVKEVAVEDYKARVEDVAKSMKLADITKSVTVADLKTSVSKVDLTKPTNGKSNYLLLLFFEPAIKIKISITTITHTATHTSITTKFVPTTVVSTSTVTTTTTVFKTATTTTTATTTKVEVNWGATAGISIALLVVGIGIGMALRRR